MGNSTIPTTVKDFLSLLEQSQLLDAGPLARARQWSNEAADCRALARRLIQQQLITSWQAARLLAGSHQLVVGNYRLIKQLGRGELGRVFLAEHQQMARPVALKLLSNTYTKDPAAVERFLADARSAAALDHPNIIHVYDINQEGDRYFIVMEFVAGRDLQLLVAEEGPLPFDAIADYVAQAARGLEHAHAHSILHGDVRPENLIVAPRGRLKILGLGTGTLYQASAASGASRDAGRPVGEYRAPEQLRSPASLDARSDIFALGCAMYYLATGRPAHLREDQSGGSGRPIDRRAGDIAQLRPDTPEPLAKICRQMLAARPEQRFQSAADVDEWLSKWQEEECSNQAGVSRLRQLTVAPTAGTAAGHDAGTEASVKKTRRWIVAAGGGLAAVAVVLLLMTLFASSPPEHASGGGGDAHPGKVGPHSVFRPTGAESIPSPADEQAPRDGGKTLADDNSTAGTDSGSATSKDSAADAATNPGVALEQRPVTAVDDVPDEPQRVAAASVPASSEPESPEKKAEPAPSDSADSPPKVESAPPPPTGAAEPAPATGSNPVAPFAGFPPAVQLPSIRIEPPATAPATDSLRSVILGHVNLAPGGTCQLRMLGGETAFKPGSRFALLADHEDGLSAWKVMLGDENAEESRGEQIARIYLQDGDLYFQWNQPALHNTTAAHLGNCVLVLQAGSDSHTVALREPLELEPLTVSFERPRFDEHWAIDAPPDSKTVRIEITLLEGAFPKYVLDPPGPLSAKDKKLLRFGETQQDQMLAFQVESDMGRSLELTVVPYFKTAPNDGFERLNAKEFQHVYLNALRQRKQLATGIELLKKVTGDQKKQADLQRPVREKQLASLDASIQHLERVRELCTALHDTARIHFRLFFTAGGVEVDLARTNQPPPATDDQADAADQ